MARRLGVHMSAGELDAYKLTFAPSQLKWGALALTGMGMLVKGDKDSQTDRDRYYHPDDPTAPRPSPPATHDPLSAPTHEAGTSDPHRDADEPLASDTERAPPSAPVPPDTNPFVAHLYYDQQSAFGRIFSCLNRIVSRLSCVETRLDSVDHQLRDVLTRLPPPPSPPPTV